VVSTPVPSNAEDESRRARKYESTKGGGRQRGGDLRSRGRRGRSRYRYRFRRGIGRWWLGDLPSDRRASSSSHMRISIRPCSLLGVFAIPGGSEAKCRFEGSPVCRRPRRTDYAFRLGCPVPSTTGTVNNSPVGAVCDTANWNPPGTRLRKVASMG
jgi:hypothetical protein